ncbi:MAG TPA: VanZ family protein [Anaerolineales bacterium]|nr:VanZ family protein [Anaerolineales bacterium]
MLNSTGARLSAALLGYSALIILLLTLNPFYLALPHEIRYPFRGDLINALANIILFLPIGFFYKLTGRGRGALILGASLSFGIETLQLFIPARTASTLDILMNTLGAGLGAGLHNLLKNRITFTGGMVGRLRLETPLMGLIYLLGLLLGVNAFTLNESPHRSVLALLIGVCGSIILSDIFRHSWEKVTIRGITSASLSTGAWFFIGTGLALSYSRAMLAIGLGVMCLTAVLCLLPRQIKDRRFERGTLQCILPVFMIYLILLAIWPASTPLGDWHAILGFTSRITEKSLHALTSRMEYLSAFTLLGYLIAEWRGRAELSLRQDLSRVLALTSSCALALEFLVGFQIERGASLFRFVMVIASALFGSMIYHLLRAHIRFLLGRESRGSDYLQEAHR